MSTADSITAHLGKLKKNFSVAERKNENSIFKINILIKGTLVIKKINNFKPDPDLDLELKNKNYNHYKKVKVAKLNKFYKKRKKLEP